MERNFTENFQNPGSEFRGAPFWAWNCKLDEEQLLEQIDYFKEMGMGGFHIHCRTGLNTPYMGEEYLSIVRECTKKAKDYGMLSWLYDEDRWPSGFGGGLVTKDEKYRNRYIVFTPFIKETELQDNDNITAGKRKLLARYEITLQEGLLSQYRLLKEGEEGDNIWYAYLEIAQPNPWYNNETYVDTLNPEAIKKFIETTHEKYYEAVGEYFGTTIPAIFTDEPQFTFRNTLGYADEKKDIIIPYTDNFNESFQAQYGADFFEILPEIVWELPDNKVSVARYHYHDHVAERFAGAFADILGNWCKEHNIMLTGHMVEEPTLKSQTLATGEAMRSYRGFGQPGIDMLCDWREYSTAKQAQSAAHQFGCRGVTSELYGVTNWDFDFRGHKLQGDWQAALGVITRVHHLSWVSMEGEAKRDYPASIFYQSPWYKEYSYIEDHFARVNMAMTQGKACVKVGVIHPIESYWLFFGPEEQTENTRKQLEQNFTNVIEWLLFGLIDFDFIAESLLPEQSIVEEVDHFTVGECSYDVVLIPECKTLRRSTLDRLKSFVMSGGKLIFMGNIPTHVDALPSMEVVQLAKMSECIPFSQTDLLDRMEFVRTIDIQHSNGVRSDNYFYQMRNCGDEKLLFIANGKEVLSPDVTTANTIKILVDGNHEVELYDTIHGTIQEIPSVYSKGKTIITYAIYPHDSLLLHYAPRKSSRPVAMVPQIEYSLDKVVRGSFPITLSEPNVLLLDQAEYMLNDEKWQASEEVLRIDNILRKKLNYPLKMEAYAQPWTNQEKKSEEGDLLRLRYSITSQIDIAGAKLAVERPHDLAISLNGISVSTEADGWYTDQCIRTIPLPLLSKGLNILEISMSYNSETNLEWAYLLGDFGVELHGDTATLTNPIRKLSFGDFTQQGLPFYGGNVTYHCDVELEDDDYELEISKYRAPLISIQVNGEDYGKIVFAPYKLPLGNLTGHNTIDITVYGNRVNSFGAIHNCDENTQWFGPSAWRSHGSSFSYEYQLKRCGILSAPCLNKRKDI
jgi:hypothetical protein